jgi:hypothetical protein
MDSTVMPKPTEADDVLALRADERLAHAYDQIARADEQLARLTEQMTRMEHEARQPPVTPARRRSRDRTALRGFIGLLAAACIAGVAFVSQSSYGEAVRPVIAKYLGSASWLPQAKQELAQQPAAPAVRLASAAEAAPAQAAPLAQAAPQDGASPAAILTSAELTQLLQTMARDLTTLQQGIDQLKASQEQLASDNAKAVEQFRASQEQMTRLVARVSEQEQRAAARLPPPPPRPVAEPARRPAPAQASSQARAQPMQLQPAATAR